MNEVWLSLAIGSSAIIVTIFMSILKGKTQKKVGVTCIIIFSVFTLFCIIKTFTHENEIISDEELDSIICEIIYKNKNLTDSSDYIDKLLESFDEDIKDKPEDFTLYIEKSLAYESIEDYENALIWVNKAMDVYTLNEKNNGRDFASISMLFTFRCELYIKMNQFDEAFIDANKAIEYDDKNNYKYTAQIYFSRMACYAHFRAYDAALEDIDTAVKLNPAKNEYKKIKNYIMEKNEKIKK